MTPAFALRGPPGFRTDSGPAALTDRTIRATGKIGAADGLTKAFHQYVKFCQFVGAPRIQCRHYRIIGGSCTRVALYESVSAQYPQYVRIDDERRHFQRAEVEGGRRDLSTDAGQALQPCERFRNTQAAKKRQVETRLIRCYDMKRVAQMTCLDVGKGHVADHGLDIACRCSCEVGPFPIGVHEPSIGGQ